MTPPEQSDSAASRQAMAELHRDRPDLRGTGCKCATCTTELAPAELAPVHPDLEFTDWRHAYVTGLIAAALAASEVFSAGIDTRVPAIRVRFGPHRYEVIVRELQ